MLWRNWGVMTTEEMEKGELVVWGPTGREERLMGWGLVGERREAGVVRLAGERRGCQISKSKLKLIPEVYENTLEILL